MPCSGDVALAVADKQRPEAEEGVAPGPKALTSAERAMVRGNELPAMAPSARWLSVCNHRQKLRRPVIVCGWPKNPTHVMQELYEIEGQRRAGWNSSTRLPEGSTSKICDPPGPTTMSLRNWRPAARKRATSAGRSSTTR